MTANTNMLGKKELKEKYKSHCVAFVVAFIIMSYIGFFYVTEGGHPFITNEIIFILGALFALSALCNSIKYRSCC